MIQFFISAIAKQTHNKKWNTLLEFAWSVQFSIPKIKRKEKNETNTTEKQEKKRKMRREEERATVISGSSYWIRKPNWRTGVWFVALFVVCMTPICQHKLIRESRKNRDYLRIIPFYFILFSTISVSLCISSDGSVYSVVACVFFFSVLCIFLHKRIQSFYVYCFVICIDFNIHIFVRCSFICSKKWEFRLNVNDR